MRKTNLSDSKSINQINKEIKDIQSRFTRLSKDNAFIVWFLKAFISDDEQSALESICGMTKDKDSDAVYFDTSNRIVFIVQGKYREKNVAEGRSAIMSFSNLAKVLLAEDDYSFNIHLNNLNNEAKQKLIKARNLIHKNNFELVLYFVTTGTVSNTHIKDAEANIDNFKNGRISFYMRKDITNVMQDYLVGASPIPSIDFEISGTDVFPRNDIKTEITSWIFTMKGNKVKEIYDRHGIRLFARNIRGYFGTDSPINSDIQFTIAKEPDYFWYYNNGNTIICDEAKQIREGNQNIIRARNAQIINGQQTARTLSLKNNSAEVLVKFFSVNRDTDKKKIKYNQLVSEIVTATNSQNNISQADLKSNDFEQVRIQKEMKKFNYYYVRKKMKRSELIKHGSASYFYKVKREDLARSLAAITVDPYQVRLGLNALFSDKDNMYGKLFYERPIQQYLSLWWVFKSINALSNVKDIYSYSKWYVLRFILEISSNVFKNPLFNKKFRIINETKKTNHKYLKDFENLIKAIFKEMEGYYKNNKKKYGKEQVPRDFFKHSKLHYDFMNYYNKNSKRKNLVKKFSKNFINSVNSFELND